MNNEHLEALIIDNELGELPDEVSSLLEAYLSTHPEAGQEAENIRQTLDMTKNTVVASPELFRDPIHAGTDFLGQLAVFLAFLKSRNSAIALLVVLSGVVGFFLKGNIQPETASSSLAIVESSKPDKKTNAKKPLWASYQIDDGGNPVLLLASIPSGSE